MNYAVHIQRIQWNRDSCSVLNFQETMNKIFDGIDDDIIVSILILRRGCFAGLMVGYNNTALFSLFLLRAGSVRIQDTIVYFGALVELISPAWIKSPWKLAAAILSWSSTLPIEER